MEEETSCGCFENIYLTKLKGYLEFYKCFCSLRAIFLKPDTCLTRL